MVMIDDEKLTRIMLTREAYMWPHRTIVKDVTADMEHEIDRWIRKNCRGEWKRSQHFSGTAYHFKDKDDHMLFALTWQS